MKLINLTPHELNIVLSDSEVIALPSEGVARCAVEETKEYEVEHEGKTIPVVRMKFGAIEGLPAPQKDVLYITSLVVASAARRKDVVSPGQLARDSEGKIIGCYSFSAHGEESGWVN